MNAPSPTERVREVGLLIALCLLALCFNFALRLYDGSVKVAGRSIDDRGRQLYQPVRWLEGQWYYRDFSTGVYTPGAILWHALLFKLFGVKMSVIAATLAGVGAGIAILAYLIARHFLPAGWAFLAYLLCLSWNVFALNIGYPSWYDCLFGLAALYALLRYLSDGRAGWLAAAGVLVGLATLFKLSHGVYLAVGVALGLAWRSAAGRPASDWKSRLLSWEGLVAGVAAFLGLFLLHRAPRPFSVLFFALPILLATGAVIAGRPDAGAAPARQRPFRMELVRLGLGWVVVNVAWALPTLSAIGGKAFLYETLLRPLQASAYMHRAITLPNANGWLTLIFLMGGAWQLSRRARARPLWVIGYVVAGMGLAALPLAGPATPLKALQTAVETWERLRPFLALLVCVVGWALLWNGRAEGGQRAGLTLTLLFAGWNLLVFYPMSDSVHLLWCIQPLFIVLVYILYRFAAELSPKIAPARWAAPAALALLASFCVALQFYGVARFFVDENAGFRPVAFELLDAGRGDVYTPARTAGAFRGVVTAVQARTGADDAVFDTCGSFINFLADRRNPLGVDFLWAGHFSPAEEAQMVAQLAAQPPALILRRSTDERDRPAGHPSVREAYPALMAFIDSHYVPVERVGEYALWVSK